MKSFTFKVAKATEAKEVKVREGVAVAGCSLVKVYGFLEPISRTSSGDNGFWC